MHTNYLQSTSLQDTSLASNLPSNYLSNYQILSGLSGGRPKVTEGYYSNIPYGFFPAGRGDGRDCGFLPSSLIKQATGVPPFTLLMEEVGRGQDAGGAGWHRRCRPARLPPWDGVI